MTEQDLVFSDLNPLSVIAFVVFAVSIFIAIGLQILAFRHKREFGSAYMLKDSLFKNKELVYTERGMRYINMQKKVAMICTVIVIALLVLERVFA